MMSDFEVMPVGAAARLAELEAENNGLRFALSRQGKSTMPEMVSLRAEVERLREKLLIACNRGDVADAEVGRLQAEVERLRDSCAAKADRIDKLGETVERLRALNGELLAALKSALSALEFFAPEESPRTLAKVRAAIAKAEGQL
jgi:predicted RNase H-like nuclease (RuvC/YqgF family)